MTQPHVAALAHDLERAGVHSLVLDDGQQAPGADADRRIQLLIPPDGRKAALNVVEAWPWRYSWARTGPMARLPFAYAWFDGGTHVDVCWRVPAAPLPKGAFDGLAQELWSSTSDQPLGAGVRSSTPAVPSDAALLVHLAVQACRPGSARDHDWTRFRELATSVAPAEARLIARRAGVLPALDAALARRAADATRPVRAQPFTGSRRALWRMALAVQARARPERYRRLLAGAPLLGDATIRCRVGGVEVLATPGVFVPTPDAELFFTRATSWLSARPAPVAVEVGTGSGAIACAVAAALPAAEVHGLELAVNATRCARHNVRRLGLDRVHIHQGSLLDPLPQALRGQVDLVIANLPFYPPRRYAAIGSVERGTIEGAGEDGLDLVRALARQARSVLRPGGRLLLQMFSEQWQTFAVELAAQGYRPGSAQETGRFVICDAELGSDGMSG